MSLDVVAISILDLRLGLSRFEKHAETLPQIGQIPRGGSMYLSSHQSRNRQEIGLTITVRRVNGIARLLSTERLR